MFLLFKNLFLWKISYWALVKILYFAFSGESLYKTFLLEWTTNLSFKPKQNLCTAPSKI